MLPIVLAIACMRAAALAASAPSIAAFPVQYSLNERYLVDQNGVPFPIMGRTAWFITSVSVTDYHTFIDDTAARGYDAIELHVVNHDPRGNNPPFNGNGDLPFLNRLDGATWDGSLIYGNINNEAPDFSTPNETYWSFVDGFLSYCETKGILVFLFPAYAGVQGGNQGWMQEMVANSATKMQSYGAWIAARYQNQKNLVWMMGGDMGSFNPAQTAVESALLIGLKSVTGQQSIYFSAEWDSGMIATDQATFGGAMTLNGAYSWSGDVNNLGRHAYTYTPVEPAFLLEEPYDEEGPDGNGVNPNATQPVRRFQWWGWLSTTGGYISGNGYVWPFRAPAWHDHLDTQGSHDMARLNAFIGSIKWYKLVPSGLNGMRTLITAGGSSVSSSDYVAAAATFDGTLLVAYIPPAHSGAITVDMAAMSDPARARWFDPTSGAYTEIGTGLPNTGTRVFTPPGKNSAGESDWVLMIEAATVAPTPTPSPTPTATATPTPAPAAQAINLSTRMRVQSGDNAGIGGFIITGSPSATSSGPSGAPKHVLLRAIGPSLTQSGVPDALADPVLELHGPGAFVTITNDNWRDDPVQEAAILATGIPPTNDLESAIDATLNPGAYTAVVRGKNNTSGVALIEVYDLSLAIPAKLANISTRAFVNPGDDIVIAGFILGSHSGDDRIVVRGIGPSLAAFGVPNALANPTLELRDGNGALLIANNDWQDDPAQGAELTAAGLAPTNNLESGIAATFPPGLYTALLGGLNNGTGVGLVEVYDRGGGP
jgi:Protein of unknown function (DUF4038)/Putative collagen-binding domain of a collagenase